MPALPCHPAGATLDWTEVWGGPGPLPTGLIALRTWEGACLLWGERSKDI